MVPDLKVKDDQVWILSDGVLVNLSDARCIVPMELEERIFLEISFKNLPSNEWVRVYYDTEKLRDEALIDISDLLFAWKPTKNDLNQFME